MAGDSERKSLLHFISVQRENLISFLRLFLEKNPEEVPIILPPLYWVICSLDILDYKMNSSECLSMISTINRLRSPDHRGFSCSFLSTVPTPLATLSALQVHVLLGVFAGDACCGLLGIQEMHSTADGRDDGAREDLRFLFARIAGARILRRMISRNLGATEAETAGDLLNVDLAGSCFDEETCRFGFYPGAEPHAGAVFCGLACLGGEYVGSSKEKLTSWLRRRLKARNGRPEKFPDVCYVWWSLASLVLLQGEVGNLFQEFSLGEFIISCYDCETGGFARRPREGADLFHTFAVLLLVALLKDNLDLRVVLPKTALARL